MNYILKMIDVEDLLWLELFLDDEEEEEKEYNNSNDVIYELNKDD